MSKEQILEKSRKENINGDEREKQIDLKSYMYGAVSLIVSLLILTTIKFLMKEQAIYDILFMFEMYLSSLFLYKYKKTKSTSNLIWFLIWLLISLTNLYLFIVRG